MRESGPKSYWGEVGGAYEMTTSNCQTRPVFKRIYGKNKEKRIDETNKTGAQQQNKKNPIPEGLYGGIYTEEEVEDPAFYNDPDKSIDLEEALREAPPHSNLLLSLFIF